MHADVMVNAKPKASQPALASFGIGVKRQCTGSRQEKITALLAKFFVANMLPLSLVDNVEFKELMAAMEPEYKVPCRQTLTSRLDSMKVELAKTVEAELAAVSSLSLTTDIWTSISNDAYISVTASYITNDWKLINRTLDNKPMDERHTQENISTRLKTSAIEWGIAQKVNAVVQDGAANMNDTAYDNGWTDVNCLAHKLHLSVISAMGINKVTNNPISKCVGAVSHLVGHFSRSPLASNELNNRQTAMNILGDNGQPLKPVQHVKTRWNSVYDMFERLQKLR